MIAGLLAIGLTVLAVRQNGQRSPNVGALKSAYDAVLTPLHGKEGYGQRWGVLVARLLNTPIDRDAALAYLDKGGYSDKEAAFGGALQSALIYVLIDTDDRDRLRKFLRTLPIDVDGPDGLYIEFDLVDPYVPRPLDNFVLLFDAYDQATTPIVREYIARAVRRAYRSEIKSGSTDDQVMIQFRQQFDRTKSELKVNLEYQYAYPSLDMNVTNRIPMPLFIPKDGPDRVKSRIIESTPR